jgi:hypothetical protein
MTSNIRVRIFVMHAPEDAWFVDGFPGISRRLLHTKEPCLERRLLVHGARLSAAYSA